MKQASQWKRTQFALEGIREAWRREKSFRIEVFLIAIMGAWMFWHQPAYWWWILVGITSAALLAVELLNTAIEMVCDAVHPEIHPLIKVAKDCAAGAVFVTACTALGIAILTIWRS